MEKIFESNQGFMFTRNRVLAKTQKVVKEFGPNDGSESSHSVDEENDIETIRIKNRKLSQKIVSGIMSFKHTSRMMMNAGGLDADPVSPFLMGKKESEGKNASAFDMSYAGNEKTEKTVGRGLVNVLKTVGRLKCQHRKVRSELDRNLEEILKVEREKKELKEEFDYLQDKFFAENNRSRRTSSCAVI